jgi:cytochrome c-type biogenesis protein CcmH/NrfG
MSIRPFSSYFFALTCAIVLGMGSQAASAAEDEIATELLAIQHAWDKANYETTDPVAKKSSFEALSARAEALVRNHPGRAEPLVWQGIVLSTYAGVKGGIGALSMAKKSRDSLLAAAKLNGDALNGSAYTSLGALYYKVPRWPVGFGDHDKAREYLRKALALNPNGIDPNYFYGELLFEEGDYAQALSHLQQAMAAPARPDRPLADSGRRAEINALIARVRAEQT